MLAGLSSIFGLGGAMMGNQLFSGGLFLLIAGYFMGYLRSFVSFLLEYTMRHFFIEVELKNGEDAHRWLVTYISENPKLLSVSQQHKVIVKRKLSQTSRAKRVRGDVDDIYAGEPPQLIFSPGFGMHILYYHGKIIFLSRRVEMQSALQSSLGAAVGAGSEGLGHGPEKLTLWSIGRTSARTAITQLITNAMYYCINKDKENTVIFTGGNGGGWDRALSKPKRALDSVILPQNLVDSFKADVKRFLDSASWYQSLGIPYRRSYLLYGPPGCGKTSFITALAGEFGLHVCVLSLSSGAMSDMSLNNLLHCAPENSIVLIEDVDAALPSREDSNSTTKAGTASSATPSAAAAVPPRRYNGVTFSGILNAIDGIASQESRIIVMTTNVLGALDPALTRPGRVDRAFHFDLASRDQAKRLFSRFFPYESDLAEEFASLIEPNQISMAALQGLFMRYIDKPQDAYDNYNSYLEELRKQDPTIGSAKAKSNTEEEGSGNDSAAISTASSGVRARNRANATIGTVPAESQVPESSKDK